MFSSILAAIAAIPKLLDAAQQLIAWFKKAEEEKWFAQQAKVMNQDLPAAQSQEDFQKVAKEIQDQIKGL